MEEGMMGASSLGAETQSPYTPFLQSHFKTDFSSI